MATLESLSVEFQIQTKNIKKEIAEVKKQIEQTAIELPIKINNQAIKDINKLKLAPQVELTSLHELNKLLDTKLKHYKEVQKYFKDNPLKIDIFSDTKKGSAGTSGSISLLKSIDKSLKTLNNLFKQQYQESKSLTQTSVKAQNEGKNQALKIFSNIEKNTKTSAKSTGLFSTIRTGLFESVGKTLFDTKFANAYLKIQDKIERTFGNIGNRLFSISFEEGEVIVDILKGNKTIKQAFKELTEQQIQLSLGINKLEFDSLSINIKEVFDQLKINFENLKNSEDITELKSSTQQIKNTFNDLFNSFISLDIKEIDLTKNKLQTEFNNFNKILKDSSLETVNSLNPLFDFLTSSLVVDIIKGKTLKPLVSQYESIISKRKEKGVEQRGIPLTLERVQQIESSQNIPITEKEKEKILQKAKKLKGREVKGVDASLLALGRLTDVNAPQVVTPETKKLILTTGGFAGAKGQSGFRIAGDIINELQLLEDGLSTAVINIKNIESDFEYDPKKTSQIPLPGTSVNVLTPILQGINKDAIEMAAQAISAIKINPDIQISLLGESGGGFIAEEAITILNKLGYGKNVKGVGTGTPNLIAGSKNTNYQKLLSQSQEEYIGQLAKNLQELFLANLADPTQQIKGIKGHTYEFYTETLEYIDNVFGVIDDEVIDNFRRLVDQVKEEYLFINENLNESYAQQFQQNAETLLEYTRFLESKNYEIPDVEKIKTLAQKSILLSQNVPVAKKQTAKQNQGQEIGAILSSSNIDNDNITNALDKLYNTNDDLTIQIAEVYNIIEEEITSISKLENAQEEWLLFQKKASEFINDITKKIVTVSKAQRENVIFLIDESNKLLANQDVSKIDLIPDISSEVVKKTRQGNINQLSEQKKIEQLTTKPNQVAKTANVAVNINKYIPLILTSLNSLVLSLNETNQKLSDLSSHLLNVQSFQSQATNIPVNIPQQLELQYELIPQQLDIPKIQKELELSVFTPLQKEIVTTLSEGLDSLKKVESSFDFGKLIDESKKLSEVFRQAKQTIFNESDDKKRLALLLETLRFIKRAKTDITGFKTQLKEGVLKNIITPQQSKYFENRISGITSNIGKINKDLEKTAKSASENLIDALNIDKIKKEAIESGNALPEGLEQGLYSIDNIGEDFAKQFIDEVNKTFGIASPSKAFIKIGEFIIAGLRKGLNPTLNPIDELFAEKKNINIDDQLQTVIERAKELEQQLKDVNDEVIVVTAGFAGLEGKGGENIAKTVKKQFPTTQVIPVENKATDTSISISKNPIKWIAESLTKLKEIKSPKINPDAIELASTILALQKKNKSANIKAIGHSAGGFIVEEALAILSKLNIKNVKGVGIGTPDIAPLGVKNYKSILSKNDPLQLLLSVLSDKSFQNLKINLQSQLESAGHDIESYFQSSQLPDIINESITKGIDPIDIEEIIDPQSIDVNIFDEIKDKFKQVFSTFSKEIFQPFDTILNLFGTSSEALFNKVKGAGTKAILGIGAVFGGFKLVSFAVSEGLQFLTRTITETFTTAIQASISFEKFNAMLGITTGNSDLATQSLKDISKEAQSLGLSISALEEQYARFASATVGTALEKDTKRIFKGFATASSALSLSESDIQGVFLALTQITAKGKISAEEFRQQLAEKLPIASQAAAEALGVTQAEFTKLLDSGKLKLTDITLIADKLGEKFADVKNIQTTAKALENLKNEIFLLSRAFGDALLPVFKLGINTIITGLKIVRNIVKEAILPTLVTVTILLRDVLLKTLQVAFITAINSLKVLGTLLIQNAKALGVFALRFVALSFIIDGVIQTLKNFNLFGGRIAEVNKATSASFNTANKQANLFRDVLLNIQKARNINLGLTINNKSIDQGLQDASEQLASLTPNEKVLGFLPSFRDIGGGIAKLFGKEIISAPFEVASEYIIKSQENLNAFRNSVVDTELALIKLSKATPIADTIESQSVVDALNAQIKSNESEISLLDETKKGFLMQYIALQKEGKQAEADQAKQNAENISKEINAIQKKNQKYKEERSIRELAIKTLDEQNQATERRLQLLDAEKQLLETQTDIDVLKGLKTQTQAEKDKLELTKNRLAEELRLEESNMTKIISVRQDAYATVSQLTNIPVDQLTDTKILEFLPTRDDISQETRDLYTTAINQYVSGNNKILQLRKDVEKTELEIVKSGVDDRLNEINREFESKNQKLEVLNSKRKLLIIQQSIEERKLESERQLALLFEENRFNQETLKLKQKRYKNVEKLLKSENQLSIEQVTSLKTELVNLGKEIDDLTTNIIQSPEQIASNLIGQLESNLTKSSDEIANSVKVNQKLIASYLAQGLYSQEEATNEILKLKQSEIDNTINLDKFRIKSLEEIQKTIGLTADQELELVKARQKLNESQINAPTELLNGLEQQSTDLNAILDRQAKDRELKLNQLVDQGVISRKEADKQIADSNLLLTQQKIKNEENYLAKLKAFNLENPTLEGNTKILAKETEIKDLKIQLIKDEEAAQQARFDAVIDANDKANKQIEKSNKQHEIALQTLKNNGIISAKEYDRELANSNQQLNKIKLKNEQETLEKLKVLYQQNPTIESLQLVEDKTREVADLTLQVLQDEYDAQGRIIDLIKEKIDYQNKDLDIQQQSIGLIEKSIDIQTKLGEARVNLSKALSDLEISRNQRLIDQYKREIDLTKSDKEKLKLKQQIFNLERKSTQQRLNALLAEQRQQLITANIEEKRNQLASQRNILDAKKAENDARIALLEAQRGGDKQDILLAQQGLEIARQSTNLAIQDAVASAEINKLNKEALLTTQQLQKEQFASEESLKLAEIQKELLPATTEGQDIDLNLLKQIENERKQIENNLLKQLQNIQIPPIQNQINLPNLNLDNIVANLTKPQLVTPSGIIPSQIQTTTESNNLIIDGLNRIYNELINIGKQKPVINQNNEFVNQFTNNNESDLLKRVRNQTLTDLNTIFSQVSSVAI